MTGIPVFAFAVKFSVPTTAGTPSSRATMAAWQVLPPWSVTMAAAVFITGSQSGLVAGATSTSPGLKARRSRSFLIRRTLPAAIFSPTARPVATALPVDLRT